MTATTPRITISIHALRGEGDGFGRTVNHNRAISIHALRGEGDSLCRDTYYQSLKFQSTPSVGRATRLPNIMPMLRLFQSTPSVGRATTLVDIKRYDYKLFQSTPSVGRATPWERAVYQWRTFQSTPSVGRATKRGVPFLYRQQISIHALRGEGDLGRNGLWIYKRPISIHALRGEGDRFERSCL